MINPMTEAQHEKLTVEPRNGYKKCGEMVKTILALVLVMAQRELAPGKTKTPLSGSLQFFGVR